MSESLRTIANVAIQALEFDIATCNKVPIRTYVSKSIKFLVESTNQVVHVHKCMALSEYFQKMRTKCLTDQRDKNNFCGL